MFRFRNVLSLCVIVVLSLVMVGSLSAQDATATPEGGTDTTGATMAGSMTNCDSSVILLYGLAQRYFGYTPSMESGLSSYSYDYGQYSSLFNTPMIPSIGGTDMSMTEEPMATEDMMMATPDTTASSTFLNPPVVTDEDPACTLLRSDLENYFSTNLQNPDWDNNFRSGMGGMNNSNG